MNPEELSAVWFPEKKEWIEYLKRFQQPITLPQPIEQIILKHYNKTIQDIKIVERKNQCPNCNSDLIQKKKRKDWGVWMGWVCPNWKPNGKGCEGFIQNDYLYEEIKERPQVIKRGSGGWTEDLEKELKESNYELKRQTIWKFLRQNNLQTPTAVERELIKSVEKREWNVGKGYTIAKRNSKLQEIRILEELNEKYHPGDIKYQQPIFYQLKGNIKRRHKIPDFLLFFEDKIIIIEAKLSTWNKNEEQKEDYLTLLRFMFPNKKIEFEYRIQEEVEPWTS